MICPTFFGGTFLSKMYQLSKTEISFPDPRSFHPENGLIAFGGDLSPERILLAYQHGIFPWSNPDEEILWWSFDPRFVLIPAEIKVSKSMQKILERNTFTFSENQCFEEVIRGCQNVQRKGQENGTWITEELIASYLILHGQGYAKSVEVWQNDELVGGFYGIDIGNIFCGDSMFATVSNASKAGFIQFVKKYENHYSLIDCQSHTPHLESLGARHIPKKDFYEIIDQRKF